MTSTKTEVLLRAAQKWRAFNNTEEDKRSRARWGCTDLSNANSAVWKLAVSASQPQPSGQAGGLQKLRSAATRLSGRKEASNRQRTDRLDDLNNPKTGRIEGFIGEGIQLQSKNRNPVSLLTNVMD